MRIFLMTPVGVVVTTRGRERDIDETEIIHKDVHANTEILTLHHHICQHGNTNTNKTKSTSANTINTSVKPIFTNKIF